MPPIQPRGFTRIYCGAGGAGSYAAAGLLDRATRDACGRYRVWSFYEGNDWYVEAEWPVFAVPAVTPCPVDASAGKGQA